MLVHQQLSEAGSAIFNQDTFQKHNWICDLNQTNWLHLEILPFSWVHLSQNVLSCCEKRSLTGSNSIRPQIPQFQTPKNQHFPCICSQLQTTARYLKPRQNSYVSIAKISRSDRWPGLRPRVRVTTHNIQNLVSLDAMSLIGPSNSRQKTISVLTSKISELKPCPWTSELLTCLESHITGTVAV